MLQVFGNIRRHLLHVLSCVFQVFAMFWTTLEDPCQRHFLDSAADVLQNNYNPRVREHPCTPWTLTFCCRRPSKSVINLPWSSIRPASPLTLKISSKLWPAISLPKFCIFIKEIVHFWLNRLGEYFERVSPPPWPQSFIKCVFSVGFHMELHLACNVCLMLEWGSGTHFILFFSASRCFNRHVARKTKTISFAASISFCKHLGSFFDFVVGREPKMNILIAHPQMNILTGRWG